jgi:hypothetical protein
MNDIIDNVFNIIDNVASTASAARLTAGQNATSASVVINQIVEKTVGLAASTAACGETIADSAGRGSNVAVRAASQSITTPGSNSIAPISSSLEDFSTNVRFNLTRNVTDCPAFVAKKLNATALGYPGAGLFQKRGSTASAADVNVYGWSIVDKSTGSAVTGSSQQITFTMTSTFDFTTNYGLASRSLYAAKCGYYNYTVPGDASTVVLDTNVVTTVGETINTNGTVTLTCRSSVTGDYVVAAVSVEESASPTETSAPLRNDNVSGSSSGGFSPLWLLLLLPPPIM